MLLSPIELLQRSLDLVRSLGVDDHKIVPDKGIIFQGRHVRGSDEIATLLIQDAIRQDDPTRLQVVHYTMIHTLHLTRSRLAQIILDALTEKRPHVHQFLCISATELGEKAVVSLADVDMHDKTPAVLQLSLCAHKQDLRDGTRVS